MIGPEALLIGALRLWIASSPNALGAYAVDRRFAPVDRCGFDRLSLRCGSLRPRQAQPALWIGALRLLERTTNNE